MTAELAQTPTFVALDARLRGAGSSAQISAEELGALQRESGLGVEALSSALLPLAQRWAFAPVSQFEVGAAALGASGAMYLGANIEFPGLPLSHTVHAEQSAISLASVAGESGLRLIATTAAPCGFCRQFMLELPPPGPILVLADHDSEVLALGELLPRAFDAGALGCAPQLLRAPQATLELLAVDAPGELATRALEAAAGACAPYTGSLAGVALETRDGQIFCGAVLESAAYNPTLGPMQAALIAAHHGGARMAEIREGVLVELEGGPVSQLAGARQVLASVAPTAVLSRRFAARR